MKRILITMLLSDFNRLTADNLKLCLYVTDIDQVVKYEIKTGNSDVICSEEFDRKKDTIATVPLTD